MSVTVSVVVGLLISYGVVRIVKGILAMVHAECGMPEQARTLLLTPDYDDPKDLPRNLGYLYALHPPSRACFLQPPLEDRV